MQEADALIQEGSKAKLFQWIKGNFINFPKINPNSISEAKLDEQRLLITIVS
jgi:hypothetical protein